MVQKYGLATGISIQMNGLCMYSLRAAAITNTLSHEADIAKLQEWLGHANVSTTRLYDRRKTQPQDSLTFRVRYQVNLRANTAYLVPLLVSLLATS
ncbi:MAG: hypothetical protein JO189_19750 [Deltaproteobacteria bacterium]|nr:hypothetical protein [Deltaproteobacteria bacterium]